MTVEDTPPKPKRSRWRWVVVGLLVALLTTFLWSRFAGSGRFVGRWRWNRPAPGASPFWIVDLESSGIAKLYTTEGQLAWVNTWQVRNNQFMFRGVDTQFSLGSLIRRFACWRQGIKVTSDPNGPFDLFDVSNDSFVIQRVGSDIKMRIERVEK